MPCPTTSGAARRSWRCSYSVWRGASSEARPSRFRTFLAGPATVLRYALTLFRREPDHHLSHNPLGGWSVMAMLLALLIQAGTGLFANDDIATTGPLYKWVSKAASDRLTSIHHLNHDVIIILIAVHVAAVLFHLVYKKENLITADDHGIKQWEGHFAGDDSQQPLWLGGPGRQRLRRVRFICWCDKKAGQSPAFFVLKLWAVPFRDSAVAAKAAMAKSAHRGSRLSPWIRRPWMPPPHTRGCRLTCFGTCRGTPCSWRRPRRTGV